MKTEWYKIDETDLCVGQRIIIRPLDRVQFKSKHTPKWSYGLKGDIVKVGEKAVTVDMHDSRNPIIVDKKDCGYDRSMTPQIKEM